MKTPRLFPRLLKPSLFICSGCQSRAAFSQSSRLQPNVESTSQPPDSGYALLPSRTIISLSGPDSTKYLQGVVTANLNPSTPRTTGGFYAAFLTSQGRLLNDVFLYPDEANNGWLIEVDTKEAASLAKHIKRYKLRSKFDVRVLDHEEASVWSVWNGGNWTRGSFGLHGSIQKRLGCDDTRAPGMGRRFILPGGARPTYDIGLHFEETTEDVYRIRRYLKGVPEGQDELLREHALPQESNIDFMGGVDYRKGCYVGQELTIRTHHRGVVRKRILPVMLYEMHEPAPDSLRYKPEEKGFDADAIPGDLTIARCGKPARAPGKFLAGVGNIGLALCKLPVMTDIQVQGEAGFYHPEDEFMLEWHIDDKVENLKLKAFVPPWLREFIK